MTTTASAAALLGDSTRMRGVSAMVRRRVPACDVEDVTQTVLCDALAAPKLPSEPTELRRFLCVLARNKIADFHRRVRRPAADVDACEEVAVAAPPVEARSLLDRLMNGASARDRETLEWLVREHEGEELKEIAADVGLPAPTVRKRVSRLRRALRAQWAHALILILAAGGATAGVRHATRDDGSAITADPSADPGVRVIAIGQGRWHVGPGTALVHTRLGPVDARAIEIRIEGRRVEVTGLLGAVPGARIASTITSSRRIDAATYALELLDDHGHVQRATVIASGKEDSLTVRFEGGAIHGTARLER